MLVWMHRFPSFPFSRCWAEIIDRIKSAAEEADIPFELITKLIVSINNNKYIARSSKMQKEFDRLINQEWIHYENIQAGLDDED